jgi:hypothetical protein
MSQPFSRTIVCLASLVGLVAVLLSLLYFSDPTGDPRLHCLLAPASEYNPIAPIDASYDGSPFVLEEKLIQQIRNSFKEVHNIPPQLSAPAWFLLYFSSVDNNVGSAFVFASDGSHAYAYPAKSDNGKVTFKGPPWGKLENATDIVALIEPSLREQIPHLAAMKFDPEKWR